MDKVYAIVPTVLCGLFLWYNTRFFNKRDKARDKKEEARIENNVLLLEGITASLALGEATADAIKNQKCNGKMTEAVTYAVSVKHKIKDSMYRHGSENIL